MKVKLNNTEEVTDDQRVAIGARLGKRPGQQASRDECRDFIWQHGASWAQLLERAAEYEDDLIGTTQDGKHVRVVHPEDPGQPTLDELI